MVRIYLIALGCLVINNCIAQYTWKLEKEKNGISVYLSDVKGSGFKAVKVECTLAGTYSKLISVLTNIPQFGDWIYNNKSSMLLHQYTPYDFTYYSETHMPWPLSNRDVVIHVRIKTDSLPHFLSIAGTCEPTLIPDKSGKVRVTHYKASWKVKMPTAETIQISYQLEVDPGGSIPAWIANTFAEKGPYGTFSNLAALLKK